MANHWHCWQPQGGGREGGGPPKRSKEQSRFPGRAEMLG